MKIYTPYLNNLLDYARYQKVDLFTLYSVLSEYNIDIDNTNEMVKSVGYLAVFDKIIQQTKNNYTGLYFGSYLNLGALGLVTEISMHTSSIQQGVLILQNFLDTKFPIVSATISQDSKNYILKLDSSVEDKKVRRHLLDMIIGIVFRELVLMLPSNLIPHVALPFHKNNPYEEALGTEVVKNVNYQIVLPIEVTHTEINQNKIKEIELLLPKYMAMLNECEDDYKDFSRQVWKMILNMCNPEIPNFEQVQKQFPYSKRTMQRKLTYEGKSFRSIANNIKKELSNYLINEKHLKTKDVAHILGYSESSAYLHAVKSWDN